MIGPDEKEWKEFPLGEVFTVDAGKRLETRNKIPGMRPFIGATDNGNGITGFVGNVNASKDKNVLGVNYNGAPCIAFYHPYECIFTDDVKRLHLINHADTSEILLYFTSIFAQQRDKYGYGYKFKEQRMLRQKLMLPITDSGMPNYEYMSEYVQECRKAMLAKYRAYVEARIVELGDYVEIPALSEMKWDAVRLIDIFDTVSRGKRLKKADHVKGDMPYVSSTALTNGNDGTCGNDTDVRVFENCLTLANSGSVGSCFYHPYRFVASDHVTALQRTGMSANVYLMLSALISRLGEKYNFNREINDIRISRERVMVPVTDSGEPNYEYMEQYAKNMMLRKYKQYLTFLDSKDKQSE